MLIFSFFRKRRIVSVVTNHSIFHLKGDGFNFNIGKWVESLFCKRHFEGVTLYIGCNVVDAPFQRHGFATRPIKRTPNVTPKKQYLIGLATKTHSIQ